MRKELLGSALVHGGIFGIALLWFGLLQPDDAPSTGSMEVELIAMASVSTNTSELIESDATEDQISAGAEQSVPETSKPIEADAPEMVTPQREPVIEPIKTEPVQTQPVEPAEPIEPVESETQPTESPLLMVALGAITPGDFAAPVAREAPLEPVETTDLAPAPVPHTLSFTRPTAPTSRPQTPKPQAAPQQAASLKAQQAGSGGTSNTDTAAAASSGGEAGAGAGGSADVARYPGQVQNKLRRALRYPRDARGDSGQAHVYFVVDSGGQVLNLSVARSSGNAIIDQAALDTVRRAAPFPSIPSNAGRDSWDFTIPLAFQK